MYARVGSFSRLAVARLPATCLQPSPFISNHYLIRHASTTAATISTTKPKAGPLAGIKVLDLSRILAGPYCTQILGDMGAEIWKIENPIGGDDTRFWGPPFVQPKQTPVIASSKSTANAYVSIGEAAYFLSVNRNKQSLAINIKDPAGSEIVRELARHADVVVENWQSGKLAEFGLDYDSLKKVNPSLIYASLTGFGSTGPLSNQPGYDLMASARGGLMHITGSPEEPSKVGVAMTDLSSGLVLNSAILAALFARERDPQRRGQHLETNLLSVQVASLAHVGQNYHCDPKMIGRRIAHSAHESIVPYQSFKCRPEGATDAAQTTSTTTTLSPSPPQLPPSSPAGVEYFICGALNNKQFSNLIAAVEHMTSQLTPPIDVSWLSDPKYAVNASRVRHRDELTSKLQEIFIHFEKKYLLSILAEYDIPSAPVNNIAQVFAEEQVIASGIVQEVDHSLIGRLKLTGSPLTASETPMQIYSPPPLLGEHTQQVLKRVLGTKTDQLKKWEHQGIIGSYAPIED